MAIKKGINPTQRKRQFIISWNNYPPTLSLEELKNKIIKKANVEYLILSFEEGEEKHTPHIQGYVRFTNAITLLSFEKIFKNNNNTYGYVDYAYGTDEDNQIYCSKQNDYIEYGFTKTKKEIEEDTNIINLIDDIINNLEYIELCKKYHKYILYHYKDFKELYTDIIQHKKEKERKELISSLKDEDLPF